MRRLSPHRKHTEELNLEEKSQGGWRRETVLKGRVENPGKWPPFPAQLKPPGGREMGSLLHRGSWGLCWGSQGRTVSFRRSRWDTREPDGISEFYLRENGAWGVNECFRNSNLGGAHRVTSNSHLSQLVQSRCEAKKPGKRWLWTQEGLPTGPN